MLTYLRVGAIEYRVALVTRLQKGGEVLNGRITHNLCRIEIDADLASQTKAVTIWHEILHSLMTQAGMDEQDEQLIETLSYGIVGVLRDNPELHDAAAIWAPGIIEVNDA